MDEREQDGTGRRRGRVWASASAVPKQLHAADNGETVRLPVEAEAWARELEEAKGVIARAEVRKKAAHAALTAAIGGATFGVLPSGVRYSYRTTSRSGYVVLASDVRALRIEP